MSLSILLLSCNTHQKKHKVDSRHISVYRTENHHGAGGGYESDPGLSYIYWYWLLSSNNSGGYYTTVYSSSPTAPSIDNTAKWTSSTTKPEEIEEAAPVEEITEPASSLPEEVTENTENVEVEMEADPNSNDTQETESTESSDNSSEGSSESSGDTGGGDFGGGDGGGGE